MAVSLAASVRIQSQGMGVYRFRQSAGYASTVQAYEKKLEQDKMAQARQAMSETSSQFSGARSSVVIGKSRNQR